MPELMLPSDSADDLFRAELILLELLLLLSESTGVDGGLGM